VRPDPGGAFDDSKLTGFGCFDPSDKVSDRIVDRLAEGRTGVGTWVVDYSALALCNHSLTFIYVDISMEDIV
jgi:hypothetical protein